MAKAGPDKVAKQAPWTAKTQEKKFKQSKRNHYGDWKHKRSKAISDINKHMGKHIRKNYSGKK